MDYLNGKDVEELETYIDISHYLFDENGDRTSLWSVIRELCIDDRIKMLKMHELIDGAPSVYQTVRLNTIKTATLVQLSRYFGTDLRDLLDARDKFVKS